jgi:predicted dehydrogenase
VAMIGAGNYAGRVLIPALAGAGADLRTLVTSGGTSGVHYGRKYGFAEASTDVDRAIGAAEVDTVVVATRHDTHARFAVQALRAGKHVFVEKPLALTDAQLHEVEAALGEPAASGTLLMVGFNRRFAPLVRKMKGMLEGVAEPSAVVITVNAGSVPAEHWTQDEHAGGGRIVGEGCHFVDLLRHLVGAPIEGQEILAVEGSASARDTASFMLRFADGSTGTVHYLTNGHRSFPKERVEVFCGGRVLQLDNFRSLTGYGWPGLRRERSWKQDKGNAACVAAFVDAVRTGSPPPIPLEEIMEVSRVSIALAERARVRGR